MAHDREVRITIRLTPQKAAKISTLADRRFIKAPELLRRLIDAAYEREVLKIQPEAVQ
jgi:hypothetical protein